MDNSLLLGFSLQMTYVKILLLVQQKLKYLLILTAHCTVTALLGVVCFAQWLVFVSHVCIPLGCWSKKLSYCIAATVSNCSSSFFLPLLYLVSLVYSGKKATRSRSNFYHLATGEKWWGAGGVLLFVFNNPRLTSPTRLPIYSSVCT